MKRQKISLTTQVIILACILLLSVNLILGIILVQQSRSAMKSSLDQTMLEIAKTAAASLDGDALGALTAADVSSRSPAYQSVYNTLTIFQNHFDIEYIYAVRDMGNGNFVFTVDPDPVDPGQFGEAVVFTDALYSASRGVAAVDKAPFEDRWGSFYSAYCPVFNSSGEVAGIVGVDFGVQWYRAQIRRQTLSIVVSSLISLFIGALTILLAMSRTRKKVQVLYNELSSLSSDVEKMTEEIAPAPDEYEQTDDNPDQSDADISEIRPSEKTIEALGGKIRSTQAKLRTYIARVHEQAYTDTMTGVGNKTAYLDLVKLLNRRIEDDNASFSIAVFDINGLKRINDNYGHEYGDMIITDAASAIRKVFGREHLFRIGGDEFIAVPEQTSEENLSALFRALDEEVARFNAEEKQYETPLSFSKGFAVYKPELDDEFKSVFKRADEAMYHDKWLHYSRKGDDRRKFNAPPRE